MAECQRQRDAVADACPSYDAWRNSERMQRYQAKRAEMIAADPLHELHRIVRGVAAKTRLLPRRAA